MKQYRQGDVLLQSIDAVNEASDERVDKVVLAVGTSTGHSHRLISDACDLIESKVSGTVFVGSVARLVHDEHATVELPTGSYRVVRQSEFADEDIRRVED